MRALTLLLCAAALPAAAQSVPIAGSSSFALETLSLSSASGGIVCSVDHAAQASFEGFAGDALGSASFLAEVGAIAMYDPQSTLGPVVLGPDPSFAPMQGGSFSVKGLNFVQGGLAGPLTVTVDGVLATDVSVLSNTTLTATAPAGASGPKSLTVSGSQGSWSEAEGFVHTPAVLVTSTIPPGAPLRMRNYGPVGAVFDMWLSLQTTFLPLNNLGVLLIGPGQVLQALGGVLYPPPDGIHDLSVTTPANPALIGVPMHFQTLSIISIFPFDVRLSNRDTVTFQ